MSRARRDVKHQFPARGGQLRDDPLQAPCGKPLIGERNGLGTELCTNQVIMGTRHTDMLDSWRRESIVGPERERRFHVRRVMRLGPAGHLTPAWSAWDGGSGASDGGKRGRYGEFSGHIARGTA